ncbi:MAG: hypothetical protein VKO00_08075 [Cyanobacteriota bacterium]|nr:hypothetical protein [Cyanobacteriota bacterium]
MGLSEPIGSGPPGVGAISRACNGTHPTEPIRSRAAITNTPP